MKVLILAPYPRNEAPSQRFRFEQYLTYLNDHEVHCTMQSFWDEKAWHILYTKGNVVKKIAGFIRGWWRRFIMLFTLRQYDLVFIHREAAPVGPPVIEWLIAKVWRKKIIYDFDDAIWLSNVSANNSLASTLKWHRKVASICKWSWKISCGNNYLAEYASRYNANVIVIPTTIDMDYHEQVDRGPTSKPVIGWTGSQSTNQYLQMLDGILFELRKRCNFDFVVISDQPPAMKFPHRFIKWSREKEIEDLSQISIGVMPLPDNQWSKGKCGFKLIQYLSNGSPAVASPVGVNTEIILHDETGKLAVTTEEWVAALESLVTNQTIRKRLGDNGRQHILKHYSVASQQPRYLALFY